MKKIIEISSNLKSIKSVINDLLSHLQSLKASEADVFDIRLCLEEVLINAIKHGNKFNENYKVRISSIFNNDSIIISVEDQGNGFDHNKVPDPAKEENLLRTGGRGIFLIKHLMDKVEFNKKGNIIKMTKQLRKG